MRVQHSFNLWRSNLGFIQMKITEDLKRTYDPG